MRRITPDTVTAAVERVSWPGAGLPRLVRVRTPFLGRFRPLPPVFPGDSLHPTFGRINIEKV